MAGSDDEPAPVERPPLLRRRQLLAAGSAAAAGLAVGIGVVAHRDGTEEGSVPIPVPSAPSGVPSAGLGGCRERVFFDDFVSDTLEPRARAKWFRSMPFGWGATAQSEAVASGSILRLRARTAHANWTIATMSPDGRGQSFGYGYFEARIRFSGPEGAPGGWPAFWSLEADHVQGKRPNEWMELDFFEAMGQFNPPRFYGTLHEWHSSGRGHVQTQPNFAETAVDWSTWNDVGCLWQPGRVAWYLNRQQVMSAAYGASAPSGSPRLSGIPDNPRLAVVLGTGPGWPLDVDWVSIWRQA